MATNKRNGPAATASRERRVAPQPFLCPTRIAAAAPHGDQTIDRVNDLVRGRAWPGRAAAKGCGACGKGGGAAPRPNALRALGDRMKRFRGGRALSGAEVASPYGPLGVGRQRGPGVVVKRWVGVLCCGVPTPAHKATAAATGPGEAGVDGQGGVGSLRRAAARGGPDREGFAVEGHRASRCSPAMASDLERGRLGALRRYWCLKGELGFRASHGPCRTHP